MPGTITKIATCCYCGTRAALVLKGRERHELACSACGAPLRELKMLKAPAAPATPRRKPDRRRKRKPLRLRKLLHEIADAVEDIFD